jgi:Domain of unknown function (DUF4124)
MAIAEAIVSDRLRNRSYDRAPSTSCIRISPIVWRQTFDQLLGNCGAVALYRSVVNADSRPRICYDGTFWTQNPIFRAMKWLILISMLLAWQEAAAQQIYKSVDRDGNISYSSEPASDAVSVETVELPPPPGEDEIEQAQQRYLELEARDLDRELERQRQEEENLLRLQIQADLELRRQLADQQPASPVIIEQYPYYEYWGPPYAPPWHRPSGPRHPPSPAPNKLLKSGSPGTPGIDSDRNLYDSRLSK